MNLALPDLRIASAVSLNSWLVTMLIDSSTAALVSQAVNEEQIDVVGAERGQPLVDHRSMSLGAARHVFGDEDDFLADLRVLFKPFLEILLGAVQLGRVEDPDAVGIGDPEDAFIAPDRARLEHRNLDTGLAQLPRGSTAVFATSSCPGRPGVKLTAEAVASAPAWRNLRRSVRSVSSCAIAFDSS